MRCDIMKMRSKEMPMSTPTAMLQRKKKKNAPCKKLGQMATNIRITMQGRYFVLQIAMIQTD
jgi:hypothetical protein